MLNIAKNFLTGEMPADLGQLYDLRQLIANDNLFSGETSIYYPTLLSRHLTALH